MAELLPDLKKTPLYDEHLLSNAKIVPFAGWAMPVEYFGLRQEHLHVRSSVGLFDVSHMGEIRVCGEKSLATLEWLTSNSVARLKTNEAQYALLLNEQGGIIDDTIVYCLEPQKDYLVCVNAANVEKDWQWFLKNNKGADLKNESSEWAQIAVQGPKAMGLLQKIWAELPQKAFQFLPKKWQEHECLVARTGYTGEDGCEIFIKNEGVVSLWRKLLELGHESSDFYARPIGLGARDTLRTEMKYSLYGQEITDQTYPFEAQLSWAVKADQKDFIGKTALLNAKEKGLLRKLIGFKMVDKGIARSGYTVCDQKGQPIGSVTSGTVSPSLNENIGIAYVKTEYSELGQDLFIDIRGRLVKAQIVSTPFVETELTRAKKKV